MIHTSEKEFIFKGGKSELLIALLGIKVNLKL